MDKLDKLISELQYIKEELTKNMNASYGKGQLNTAAGSMSGSLEQSEQKVNLNNPYNEQSKGTKSEDERNDRNDKEPQLEGPENLKEKDQPSIEKMEIAKNGQWSLKSKAKKQAPKKKENISPSEIKELEEVSHPSSLTEKEAIKLTKEEMSKDSADPKLAPKDRKVKELQSKIDAGTYKPDASKIADAIIKRPDNPLKKTEELDKANSSIYNAGMHPMKGRASKEMPHDSFPHYDYDHNMSHEDNVKQAKSHFDKHKVSMNDTRLQTYLKQAKAK